MNQATHHYLTGFFGRCFLVSVAIQLALFGLTLALHDAAYTLHTRFFELSPPAFDTALYAFFAAMKLFGIVFFLVPWVALRLMAARTAA